MGSFERLEAISEVFSYVRCSRDDVFRLHLSERQDPLVSEPLSHLPG